MQTNCHIYYNSATAQEVRHVLFFYPDHPDIQQFNIIKNKTTKLGDISGGNYILGPTSCDDLNFLGNRLKGFYIIGQNTLKVKIIYCEFNTEITKNDTKTIVKRSTLKKNERKNVSSVCKGIGSQPCSCYYFNFSEILQFELSSDEITRNAVHVNYN